MMSAVLSRTPRTSPHRRAGRLLAATVLGGLLTLLWGGLVAVLVAPSASAFAPLTPVPATAPLDVPGPITDPEGALGSRTAEVQDALDQLSDETALDLFVVYVDSFDGQDGVTWANATANLSGLGDQDILLAVATGDRRYGFSVANGVITDAQFNQLESVTEDQLRDENWADAAIVAADSLRGVSGSGASGGSGMSSILVVILVLVVLVVLFFVIRAFMRSRKGGGAAGGGQGGGDELSTLSTEDLNRRASSALVAIDDAMKTSEQELGFAEAQFGIEATKNFKDVVATGKQKVSQAFTLRQQLDDSTPESEPQARTMMAQIVTLCDEVAAALDAESQQFDELRDLEARAPEVLDEVDRRAGEIEARVAPARDSLTNLATAYPVEALASVSANPDQAVALLTNAREAVAQGKAELAKKNRSAAVAHARAAENAVGQAVKLLDAVDHAGTDLAEAGAAIDRGLTSITADITDAAQLAPDDMGVRAATAEAKAAVAVAQGAQQGGDPLAALRRLTEAEATLDAALAPTREHAEQAARATALLRETLGRVDSQIRATNDFIETRRGAVGPEARTRLSEAIRVLTDARNLEQTDPVTALAAAQRAESLAAEATQLAQRDASDWTNQQQGGGGGGMFGGGGGGNNIGGMVLGGIILDQILGGGRSSGGGGFGGGGFGGGFGGGRSGGSRPSRPSGGRSGRGGRF